MGDPRPLFLPNDSARQIQMIRPGTKLIRGGIHRLGRQDYPFAKHSHDGASAPCQMEERP